MESKPWYRSEPALLLAAVLLPPLGLVLLWLRAETRISRKVLGSLAIGVLAIAHLVLFFGLRMEMDGTGMRPIFSFYKPESHYAAIDRSRAEQRGPVAEAAASPTSAQAPAESSGQREGLDAQAATENPGAEISRSVRGAYWTDYRGPRRDGHYEEMEILTEWPSGGLPRLWRMPIGGGYASFVIADGRAFTIEQRRQQEVVTAYDIETGRELWVHAWVADFRESMGGDGPRATPTWHEGRIYALGATGELRCLEAETGKRIWSRNILSENQTENLTWGMAASPLIVDEKVIVLPGGSPGKSVVAYHKLTGEPIWKALDDRQAYTSPMVVTLAGKRQLLVVSARRAMGVAVEDGSLLWEYPWTTEYDVNSAQPIVVSANRFFISAGYGHGAAVVEISRTEGGFTARRVWENQSMKNRFNSSVLYQGHVYGLDEGILACVDVATGERKWKGGRYGYGQLLLAGGHLIVVTESGELVLVKAAPAHHQELAQFPAIEGKTWNNPAIAGGRLLVRNTTEMACFRISRR